MGSIPETVEMVNTVAENPVLENGGSSLPTATPKYKRRRVSAVRDFPPGCGPNAPQLKSNSDAGICCSENVKDTEKKWPQVQIESVVQASSSGTEDPSEDSKQVKQEITTGASDGRKETGTKETPELVVTEEKTVVEESSLPYYPIPSTVVWKERSYPPRRRVSAVRDFPAGCGSAQPPVEDSDSDDPVQTQPEPEKSELLKRVDDDGEIEKGAIEGKDCEEMTVYRKDKGERKRATIYSDSTIAERVEKNVSSNQNEGSVVVIALMAPNNDQLKREVGAENTQVVGEVQSEEDDDDDGKIETGAIESKDFEEMIVYKKDKGERKRSTIYSDSTIAKRVEKNESSNQNEGSVMVIALMAPNNDQLKQEVGADKTSSLASPADDERENKSVADKRDKLKLMEDSDRMEDLKKQGLGAGKASSSAPPANLGKRIKSCAKKRNKYKSMEDTDEMKDLKKDGLGAGKASSSASPADLERRSKSVSDKRKKVEDTDEMEEDRMEKTSGSVVEDEIVVWDERNSPEEEKRNSSRCFDVGVLPFGPSSSTDRGARFKVKETLRLFQAVLRKILQEFETKPKEGKNGKSRIDLQAAKILKSKGKYVNTGAQILGPVPGVEVGDEFHYRVELMMIGLHRQSQAGIDCAKIKGKVIATSIVASGGYDNEVDNSDVLKFSGQGGNVTDKDKKPEDQKLERGNLGLKNSIDERNFVRVIRGVKETTKNCETEGRPKVTATYTYDGLYTVERYWQETGKHGKKVYMFELKRLPNQPELVWKQVKDSKKKVKDDISEGKEKLPISAINTVDDEKPPTFTYITRMMYPDWCNPLPLQGCNCKNGCADSSSCPCVVKNGGEIPYNFDGAIIEAKPLVFECGPSCKCPSSCHNRVSQHGIKFQLEIFKTGSRGWGVRSLSSIPSGSFICEYIGELLEDTEAEKRSNDEYLFDVGHKEHSLQEGVSDLMPDSGFTIDAAKYGNVGRFINHSCSPNLYAQDVLYDHTDTRMPHVMLFAAENIPPLQELTYHYNYKIGQVLDKDGKAKVKNCYCGSSECEGRMY